MCQSKEGNLLLSLICVVILQALIRATHQLGIHDELIQFMYIQQDGGRVATVFHDDDCQLPHLKESVVEDLVNQLSGRFGKEKRMLITHKKKHNHLNLMIDYSQKGQAKFYMYDYVEQILNEADFWYTKGTSFTPAGSNLFKTNDDAAKLLEDETGQFHRSVEQLLFLSKRTRPDLQTPVAFLCT